ncbi:ATP-binding protein [Alteriqipengyuania sp. WL0013]|uniref:ATP-binding protein n=1 Tax=Alteriqipengyuania sp. WL0013 TaxID=3110773 RepID=UPI002C3E7C74|nr:ATP-binding protein [Alteriqipengyuania sp. WL0013]MEB3415960.1 ATP-binding protein [Alteriqipengyuania sp. WL0013]
MTGHAVPIIRAMAGAIAIALGFLAIAAGSIELTRGDQQFAAVWLPNAVAVAMILRIPSTRLGMTLAAIFVAGVSINLVEGSALATSLAFSVVNVAEIAVAVLLLRRWCGERPDPSRLEFVGQFLLAACVLAPLVGLLLPLTGQLEWGETLRWYLTDSLGMMLGLPSVLILWDALADWRRIDGEGRKWLDLRGTRGWIMPLGLLVVVGVFAQSSYPLLFFCATVVVVFAYHLGLLATVMGTIWIALVAIVATAYDSGPISLMAAPLDQRLMVLQAFLASVFLTGVPVAAALRRKRRLLRTLEDQKRKLALLANNLTDAVMRFDLDGVCIDASPSVRTVLGRPPKDFIGKRPDSVVHPEAQVSITDALARLTGGKDDNLRFTYRRLLDAPDGTPVYIEADCALVDDRQYDERTIIVCARDVTERVALEAQLIRARRHAENAATAKSQFLANMSHEIRTPMNGVLGFAELLQRSDLPPEQARQVQLIAESGKTMMRLLNDILDISKIEAGQTVMAPEPVDLRHLVDSCVKLQSANAAAKGIALTCEVEDGLPRTICTDGLRMRQILLNLLGNAIKFTSEGGVKIAVHAGADGMLEASVSDSGVGIPEDRLESIFQPFEQADNATSRRFGGTGLGLTISRQLAELLGGTLTAASTYGEGSRFTLELPLVEANEDGAAVEMPEQTGMNVPHGRRILLAEDHDINRILATAMLENCGQRVVHAEDGREAADKAIAAHRAGEPFDLVLMDVQMPRLDGYGAAREIREAGIDGDMLPIVALTANAFDEDRAAAGSAGMQDHLSKPIRYEDLAGALSRWLGPAVEVGGEVGGVAGRAAGGEAPPPPPLPTGFAAPPPSDSLQEKWLARRREALDAVAQLVREGQFTGEVALEVARTAHKLAGTAGMFGEEELGKLASELELALKAEDAEIAAPPAAEALLRAA